MQVDFFISALKLALSSKTLYVMGCFGAPMTEGNKERYKNNHSYNRQSARRAMIDAADADTFGFDCVNLIKGILWGWDGDTSKTYGGAVYLSNGVPDVSANQMLNYCSEVADFTSRPVERGEFVWMDGHCGIYVGDGYVIECSPKWNNGVQMTELSARKWLKHGYLQFVDYSGYEDPPHKDNEPDDWAKEACDWCVEEGFFSGDDTGDFKWHSTVTRQELAQVIYRAFGSD